MKKLFNEIFQGIKLTFILAGICVVIGFTAGASYGIIKQTFIFAAKLFL